MLALQLFANGLVTGCALAVVAISFSLVYATTRIFHVAHAGIYSLGGYVAWTLTRYGMPFPLALALAMAVCAALGALIQRQLYERLERRRATHLVVLIASLGALAVIQNLIAALYSPNILQFPGTWGGNVVSFGPVRLANAQLLVLAMGAVVYPAVFLFAHRTVLGSRMRAVASNPALAEITRLRPHDVYVIVIAI
ncbi:MAG: branched-chain amino acid ABC transporter permease, partial [Nevskiales bacterium]